MGTYLEPPADVFAALRREIRDLRDQLDAINQRTMPTVPIYNYDNLPQDAIEGQVAIIENAAEGEVVGSLPPGANGFWKTVAGVLGRVTTVAWGELTGIPSTFAPSAHKDEHKSGGGDAFASSDLLEAIVKRIQESGGPTTLTLGSVVDGEYLKRSGSTVVSGTPSGGGGSVVIGSTKLYDYEVTGSDKASIDTNVDGTTIADFAGYDVLEFWFIGRTDDAGANVGVNITVNNDTGANYDEELVGANNTTAAGTPLNAQSAWAPNMHGAGAGANYPGIIRGTIPFHTATTFYKSGEITTGKVDTTAGNNFARLWVVAWRNTAAITRLKVAAVGAAKLKVGSRLIVFGKGASSGTLDGGSA